jgi:hypothetical protein
MRKISGSNTTAGNFDVVKADESRFLRYTIQHITSMADNFGLWNYQRKRYFAQNLQKKQYS